MILQLDILFVASNDQMADLLSQQHHVWRASDPAAVHRVLAENTPALAVVDSTQEGLIHDLLSRPSLQLLLLGDPGTLRHERIVCALPQDTPPSALIAIVNQVALRLDAEARHSQLRHMVVGAGELLPIAFYTKDTQGRKTFSSRLDYETLGATCEADILGKTDLDIFRINDGAPLYQDDMDVIRTGKPLLNHQEEFNLPDGRHCWVLTSKVPLRDDSGEIIGLAGAALDITARKEAELALAEMQSRFRASFDASVVGMAIVDGTGQIIEINDAGVALLGYTREELLTKAFDEVSHPDDVSSSLAAFRHSIETGEPFVLEKRYVTKAGDILWALTSVSPIFDDEGNFAYAVSHLQDVTERKQAEMALHASEAMFRRTFDASAVGMVTTDEKGQLVSVNAAFCEMLGYDRDELQGQSFGDLTYPDDLAESIERHSSSLRTRRAFSMDKRYVHKEGHVVWAITTANPIFDAEGNYVCSVGQVQNLTERKRAEQALTRSEARFRALMEQSPLAIAIFGPDGCMTQMNQAYARLFGLTTEMTQDAMASINIFDLAALTGPVMVEKVQDAFGGRQVMMSDYQSAVPEAMRKAGLIDQEGTRPWLRSNYYPLMNQKGQLMSVVLIHEDITESRAAVQALRESEERYRLLFASMTQGVFYLNAQGRIEDINEAGLAMFGMARQEVIGRAYDDLDWYVVDESGRQLPPDQFPSSIALRTGKPQIDRVVGLRNLRHGQIVWVNLNVLPQLVPGERVPRQVFVTMQDITTRRSAILALIEREAELRHVSSRQQALLSAIPDIVAETDRNKRMTWLNLAGLDFFGDDAVGLQASDFFVGEQDTYDVVQPLFDGSEDTIYLESWQRRKDGAKRLLAWWCRTLKDEAGQVIGALSTARDITDQHLLEEQYRQAQKMESVGRLAGGVAHDFNNMLQVILGHTEMTIAHLDHDDPMLEDLVEVQRAAQRSAGLTRQLLGFARQQTVAPEVLDLNDSIVRTLRMLQRLIGEEVNLVWKPGINLGSVRIDPSQLDQILANLCVNARDAIEGIGEVLIETRNVDFDFEYCRTHSECQPGQYVMLSVSDTGCGMGPNVLEHLFEPFFTTKDVGEGTGLGLAMVYGIVKQNHGFVRVYSETGVGSTFNIYFPRLKGPAGQVMAPGRPNQVGGNETILVVEDEPTILRLAQVALRRQGYKVLVAPRPSAALELVDKSSEQIDLLITDVVMPEMNGSELADLIRANRPTIKTLFMSGYTANVVVHRGVIDAGIELLQKPFSINELAMKVRQVLDQQR